MSIEPNGFFEYLELQGGTGHLITKSELQTKVRRAGYQISPRQLTFYTSEGLVPQSMRAGSRSGVYPAIVIELMIWLLAMRKAGASIEALRELLPVWKFLVRSRTNHVLDLVEFEMVARQYADSAEAQFAVPAVVSHVMLVACCAQRHTREQIMLIDKDRVERPLTDPEATVAFAIARQAELIDDDQPRGREWIASARITLSGITSPNGDPTVVRLGRKPNELMPADDELQDPESERNDEGVMA